MVDSITRDSWNNSKAIQDHFHNYEVTFGLATVPTATHFGDVESLNPYIVTSGNNAFGVPLQALGTSDTPFRVGSISFDPRRVSVVDVSNNTPFILRTIWGNATQTAAQAITALQYTDNIIHQPTANGQNKPHDIWMIRLPSGTQLWFQIKNATNNATMNILFGLHEYPSSSQ